MTIQNDDGRQKSRWIDRAKEWIRYAQSDLRAAERLLADDLVLAGISCFHAQQAAEKALKAVLVLYGIDFPRTHDLVLLSRLLPRGVAGMPDEMMEVELVCRDYAG
ncbi:MAG: HEPN domain-containing protein [Limnochordales bacterium]|nr:HEPN domain-containing protein [Limnochordales bacterium]